MRRQPTAEQKAQAAERRAKFRALVDDIAAMSEEQRLAIVDRIGAVPTCEGHPLSVFNTCLLVNQLDTVSMVGGFNQWRTNGRQVRKGEHALAIFIPKTKAQSDAAPANAEDEKTNFFMGYVFDISQTEPANAEAQA